MTYAERLKDPRWQRKRLEILQRDNWRCCCCNRADLTLQVHHLIYAKRDPWDYPNHVYQTLCEPCHEARQELTDKIVDGIRLALRDIPTDLLEKVGQRIFNSAMESMEDADAN